MFFLARGVFTVNVMRKQTNKQKDPQVLLFLFLEFAYGYLLYFDQGRPVLMLLVLLTGGATWNSTTRRVSSQAPEILFLLEISLCPGGIL